MCNSVYIPQVSANLVYIFLRLRMHFSVILFTLGLVAAAPSKRDIQCLGLKAGDYCSARVNYFTTCCGFNGQHPEFYRCDNNKVSLGDCGPNKNCHEKVTWGNPDSIYCN
jgi:hypothetical protein